MCNFKGTLLVRDRVDGVPLERTQVPLRARQLIDAETKRVAGLSERFAMLLHLSVAAFDDLPLDRPALMVRGVPVADHALKVDYRRIVSRLVAFKLAEAEDLAALFAVCLVYFRQMLTKTALPLSEQMVEWFGVENVVYCVAFLAHSWLDDESLPLRAWHSLCEGNVQGVNLNKCVRNVLRILKYKLFVQPGAGEASLASLQYEAAPAQAGRVKARRPELAAIPEKRPEPDRLDRPVIRVPAAPLRQQQPFAPAARSQRRTLQQERINRISASRRRGA
jgi:hypothetical protein